MNKQGFTLVELLASISILAIITVIATFSYTKVMNENKIKQCEQKVLYIKKQAIKYASDNPQIFRTNENNPTIEKLICEGYLVVDDAKSSNINCPHTEKMIIDNEDDITNPLTNNLFRGNVKITKSNGLIDVTYEGDKCE